MQDPKTLSSIRDLTRQQFSQFHKVRSKKSFALGAHQLLVRNRQKYVAKQLPIEQKFISTRLQLGSIFRYNTDNGAHLYIFPLFGQPLSIVSFLRRGQKEVQEWLQICGGIEKALWEVITISLKATQHWKVRDILPECYRISKGKVLYCYDSWMTDSRDIVRSNPHQLQNHYFSEVDLKQIQQQQHNTQLNRGQYTSRKNALVFRIALFVLNLGTVELKLRNYEYAGLNLKWSNLQERLKLFKSKYHQTNLSNFLEKVLIEKESLTMQDLWKLSGSNRNGLEGKGSERDKYFRPSLHVRKKPCNAKLNSNKSKKHDASISYMSHLNDSFQTNTYSQLSHTLKDSTNLQRTSIYNPKKCLKLKQSTSKHSSGILFSESNFQKNISKDQQGIQSLQCGFQQLSEPFNIKKRLTEHTTYEVITKLIVYLGLEEYIPRNEYQNCILKVIEDIEIKSNWKRKVYPNGSLYFGQIEGKSTSQGSINEDREGKGLYLFESDDFYYGDWKQNRIHGFGVYIFRNGEQYQGSFRNGKKCGHGSYRYADGRVFEGTWHNNIKTGLGTIRYSNQVIFMGIFNNKNNNTQQTNGLFIDEINNKQWCGILQEYYHSNDPSRNSQQNQFRHKPQLKGCRVEMFSQFTTKQGNIYEGQCLQGKKHGFGVLRSQKEVYSGQWKDDLQDGQGTLTVNGQFTLSGRWSQGLMCEYQLQGTINE